MVQYNSINDVVKIQKLSEFKPGNVEIWYAKSQDKHEYSFFLWEKGMKLGIWKGKLPSNKIELRKTHNKLGSISEGNKDKIYYLMQGEKWSPHGEAKTLIKKKGLEHTSMSIGDVIYFRGSNSAWIVKSIGFKKLW